MIAGINLKNKKVLIVGGGNVAVRKAKLFLQEQCHLTVVAPHCDMQLKALNVEYIQDVFDEEYLENKFLVYAATNNEALNHEILKVCNRRNILCGSATKDELSSYQSVPYIQHNIGVLGLQTKESLPYVKPILEDMSKVLDQYDEVLTLLMSIRSKLQNNGTDTKIMKEMFGAPLDVLRFIDETLNNKGYLYVYHTVSRKQSYNTHLTPSLILSIKEFEQYQPLLIGEYDIIPLVISYGNIYDQIKDIAKKEIGKPLVEDEKELLELLLRIKKTGYHMIVMEHSRKNNLYDNIKQPDISFCNVDKTPVFYPDIKYQVIIMLMTKGNHYNDVQTRIALSKDIGFDIYNQGLIIELDGVMNWLEIKNKRYDMMTSQ